MALCQNAALRLTEPAPSKDGTILTNEPAILLKGTLAWTGGDRRILWESNRGFSDLATVQLDGDGKTVLWSSTAPVPLRPGINHVRIKALGQPGAATFVNIFYSPKSQEPGPALRTAIFRGQQITYEVRDGLAIYQGDIILGKAEDVAAATFVGPATAHSAGAKSLRPESVSITPNFSSPTGLWPVVNGVAQVPYTITPVNSANTANINAAITESNTQLAGVLQWVPASGQANQVNFAFTAGGNGSCESFAGMQGGTQSITGSANCTTTTILHEMGHAVGLYHEQSRADRNNYVNYMEQNIDKPNHGNFNVTVPFVGSGLYNYASIMEYGPFSFNKDGVSPTLETIPAGMVLGTTMPQYTTGDLDGIMRLYAHAPSAITVETNPTGLQVVVDGTTCTAPCVFTTWTSGSQHTLNVPLDTHGQTLQALSGENYIFGRWNAGAANVQSVTITNSLGNGTLLSPSTSPAVTNYLASYIPVHPYSPVVSPTGDGVIGASPPPSSLIINGTATNYYQDRQLVTLTVTPNSGYNFLFWGNVPLLNLYNNPFSFYITSNFDSSTNGNPTTALLVSDAVTTVTAASPDVTAEGIFPGFAIGVVDGNGNSSTAFTPANFDAAYNGAGFGSGKNLTFSSAATESPVTTNISYAFNNWTGGGTPSGDSLGVTVGSTGSQATYTSNYIPSFRSIVEPSLYCSVSSTNSDNALTVTASPVGTNVNPNDSSDGDVDAFFTAGKVNITAATGTSGLSFAGWSQDLASGGTTNPLPYSLAGQMLGTANFNLSGIAAPLTITGISPAAPTVSNGPVTLTITGTGFSTSSSTLFTYWVDPSTGFYHYRSSTPGTATQLTMQLCGAGAGCPDGEPSTWPGDVSTAGYYQIVVLNSENTTNCNPSAAFTFPVANSAGPPVLGITKTHTGNFNAGQQNAQYTIQVSNTGTGATVGPVTVTEAVPSGETLVSMSGSGWTCVSGGTTCTRSDSLNAGLSYGAITVTVNVAAGASSPQVNTAMVSGGGASSATATNSTTIIAEVSVPNVVGDTQSAASTALQSAGLVTGTVTMMSSGTVASGKVISENPTAGTQVVAGSAVNLVVSSGPAQVAVPNVVGDTLSAATTAITGAGLVVGSVTTQSSTTVAPGNVISESPTAGTSVNTGSAVNLVVSASSASYTGLDTTTEGTWTGKYGADGYMIPNDVTSPPAYASVSLTGDNTYTWSSSTTSPSALQVSSGSSSRIASTYYASSNFTVNLNLTDGKTHRIALYLLDWSNPTVRNQTITISDAASNTVLSTQTFSGFQTGDYAAWNIQGHVLIKVTCNNGSNAVLSGIFFDPVPVPSSASYTGLDTTTEGTWTGKYGADGYMIPNDVTNPPAYASVSLTGDNTYTWSSSTTSPSALQVSSGSSSRIASTYYASSNFTVNLNLADGKTHRIALYLLDWSNPTVRNQTITISDAVSNTVLSTQTFSSFQTGDYAAWNIQGHVLIKVTCNNGSNAVLSGIFFDPVNLNSAAYTGLDTTTEGTWTGKYGADGYMIPNDVTNPPAYASVALTGDNTYTWSTSTTSPSALQVSSGSSSRIASTYYASSSFTVNLNLTDGNIHRIALYLLDWSNPTVRNQTITISDAVTNTVLSTQTFSSFQTGDYAVWNIQGHVLIKVTCNNGSNAVLSGIFFN